MYAVQLSELSMHERHGALLMKRHLEASSLRKSLTMLSRQDTLLFVLLESEELGKVIRALSKETASDSAFFVYVFVT